MKDLLTPLIALFILSACNSNERMVKKFIKRINAREINSASKYLWPEDHASLYVFNERFLAFDKLTTFDIYEVNENGTTITAKINLLNAKEGLKAYFDSLGMLKGNTLNLTFTKRKTEETDYISLQFPWDDCGLPSQLKRSSIETESLNLRSGPGLGYPVQKVVSQNEDILIDANYKNNGWRKGFDFSDNGPLVTLYFSSKLSDEKDISFFTLGYFGTVSIILLSILGVLIWFLVYPLVLFGGIFKSASEAPQMALVLLLLMISSMYFTYQLLENMLFEIFMINIPY
ncbi:MAG: hypothetical protein ACKOWW_07730 [Flavobacteriales bacterium]